MILLEQLHVFFDWNFKFHLDIRFLNKNPLPLKRNLIKIHFFKFMVVVKFQYLVEIHSTLIVFVNVM